MSNSSISSSDSNGYEGALGSTTANVACTVPKAAEHNLAPPELALLTLGSAFLRRYYTAISNDPDSLSRFYSHDSTFAHPIIDGGVEELKEVTGQPKIAEQIKEIGYSDSQVQINTTSCHCTVADGIVVQVIGRLRMKSSHAFRRFCQTFVLKKTAPKKYHVQNDIFQYLDTAYQHRPMNTDEIRDDAAEDVEFTASESSVDVSIGVGLSDASSISTSNNEMPMVESIAGCSGTQELDGNQMQFSEHIDHITVSFPDHTSTRVVPPPDGDLYLKSQSISEAPTRWRGHVRTSYSAAAMISTEKSSSKSSSTSSSVSRVFKSSTTTYSIDNRSTPSDQSTFEPMTFMDEPYMIPASNMTSSPAAIEWTPPPMSSQQRKDLFGSSLDSTNSSSGTQAIASSRRSPDHSIPENPSDPEVSGFEEALAAPLPDDDFDDVDPVLQVTPPPPQPRRGRKRASQGIGAEGERVHKRKLTVHDCPYNNCSFHSESIAGLNGHLARNRLHHGTSKRVCGRCEVICKSKQALLMHRLERHGCR